MTVLRRLLLGFGIVIIAAATVGIIGFIGMQTLRGSGVYMYEKNVRVLEYVNEAVANFNKVRISAFSVIVNSLNDDKKSASDSKENFLNHADDFLFWMEKIRETADNEELLKFHERIVELFTSEYSPKALTAIDLSINDVPNHYERLYINVQIASLSGTIDNIDNMLTGMVALTSALANQTNIDNTWLTQNFIIIQIMLLGFAVSVGLAVAFLIIKSITVPINETSSVLKEIAQGNFEARVTGHYKGDFKIVKDSVNDMAVQLKDYLDKKMQAERSAHESDLAKARVEAATEAVMEGIGYASKIQANLLPPENALSEAFSDHSVIWEPRDVVGGDIYWAKNFGDGTVLCVCDCTGHGTPGALLTMLVVSTFESTITGQSHTDTAEILYMLDQRLAAALNVKNDDDSDMDIHDGCDLAVLFIAKDGGITMSTGNMDVFVCDGKEVIRFKGQPVFIGEGRLKSKAEVETVTIPANADNKFYIASDGIFDQIGGDLNRRFGYKPLERIVLDNHNEKLSVISSVILDAFKEYQGDQPRRDDVELVAFKP
ncbi:MAG: SpoIIE family protein phosphatase [Defluviitaleaceae bacterium]|nr:SpoIIE family protein phosphatase [Defluviitaleaceae bacterium]